SAIAVDNTFVYWTTARIPDATQLPTDVELNTGAVVKMPLAGGTPTTLASRQGHPLAIAVDPTNVYWVNGGTREPGTFNRHADGSTMKVPLAGGVPVTLASGQRGHDAVAIDATSVYWANYCTRDNTRDGAVMKVTPK